MTALVCPVISGDQGGIYSLKSIVLHYEGQLDL